MRVLQLAAPELKEKDVRVIGVSTDPVSKQLAFCNKYNLTFDLLSDPEADVVEAFGVPLENGRAGRESFIFRNGRMIWHDDDVYPSAQARTVLQVIRKVEAEEAASAIDR